MKKSRKNIANDRAARWKKNVKLAKFLVIYIGVIALYYLMVSFNDNLIIDYYIDITSAVATFFLQIFDSGVHLHNKIISGGNFNMILSFGCEGSEPLAVFAAGIIAFPSVWKQKMTGLLWGIPFLYFLNIIRIMLLYFIGNNMNGIFDLMHTTVFPVIFILISLILWMLWIKKVSAVSSAAA